MDLIAESKKNHVWRKTVWHTDPDQHPLTAAHSVEVYCCEEANGYSIWYVRKLGKNDGRGRLAVENGDYLLRYFARDQRDAAIEWAVLAATGGVVDGVIDRLDDQAGLAQRV